MKYTNQKRKSAQEFIINDELLNNMFIECNKLYFNNTLPLIKLEIISDTTINGNFIYNVDYNTNTTNSYKIQISNARKRTKNSYIATLIHEILHYLVISKLSSLTIKEAAWYELNGNIDKVNQLLYNNEYAHTGEWLEKANSINKLYGIKINKG